jgi:hypothetical protein
MFHDHRSPASTVEREALCYLLYRAFLFIRLYSAVPEQTGLLSDLADAFHNVPIVIERYKGGHDAEYLVALFFRAFDAKWGHVSGAPRLESLYRSSVEAIRKRDASEA